MTYSTYLNVCMGIVAFALTGLLLFVVWLFLLEPVFEAWQRAREKRRIRAMWGQYDGIGSHQLLRVPEVTQDDYELIRELTNRNRDLRAENRRIKLETARLERAMTELRTASPKARTNKVPNPLLGENLSEYIDGEVRRGRMWSEPEDFVHMAQDGAGGLHKGASRVGCCEWPDPDKDDCPVWMPQDPTVPYKDRTPCRLDSGHKEDHDPMDQGTMERAEAISKRVKGRILSWDDAAEQYDHEAALDIARHRRWVQLTVIGSPPIGVPIKQADPLEVHAAVAPLLGFELVSSVAATVLDTPAAVND